MANTLRKLCFFLLETSLLLLAIDASMSDPSPGPELGIRALSPQYIPVGPAAESLFPPPPADAAEYSFGPSLSMQPVQSPEMEYEYEKSAPSISSASITTPFPSPPAAEYSSGMSLSLQPVQSPSAAPSLQIQDGEEDDQEPSYYNQPPTSPPQATFSETNEEEAAGTENSDDEGGTATPNYSSFAYSYIWNEAGSEDEGGKKVGMVFGVVTGVCLVGLGGLVYLKKRNRDPRRSKYQYLDKKENV